MEQVSGAVAVGAWPGVLRRYRELLDLPGDAEPITLCEGGTPLLPVPRLRRALGAAEVRVKYEGLNPTGSFKDRGMTAAMSEAVHGGARAVICASTGNTAASAAAYAARAGVACYVLIPAGKVAAGKLAGAIAYGARVVQIDGSFDDALALVRQVSERRGVALVNSLNPFRLEGQKTAAFEVCDELGRAPDLLALPVGNAGNITAWWMGFKQYHALGRSGLPELLGVQAEGAAPLVLGRLVEHPETVATAIRIGRPARGDQALQAARESGGRLIAVSDAAILAAQRLLAADGVWVEPASAAGVAGLLQERRSGRDFSGKLIAVVCTGHGMKDPGIVTSRFEGAESAPARLEAIEELLDP
jgi:threonine synthase